MNVYLSYTNFLDSLIRYLDVPCHLINVIYLFVLLLNCYFSFDKMLKFDHFCFPSKQLQKIARPL